ALCGCDDMETRPVRLHVTSVQSCRINDCSMMTLQCIGSARAVLTPEGGAPMEGACTVASGSQGTVCDPTPLFPQPPFDQVAAGRVKVSILGYKDATCQSPAFEADSAVFDLASAASSPAPVAMTASCTTSAQTICEQVLNVQGNIVSWPPDAQRDPPQLGG